MILLAVFTIFVICCVALFIWSNTIYHPVVEQVDLGGRNFKVVIIGAGFSGLGLAIRLKQMKIPFVVLEKGGEVGGTWFHNRYPGAACDIPSHLYCYSFEPKHDWSTVYPKQPEILDYMKHCAIKYDIYPHIKFGVEVDEANFDSSTHLWEVKAKDGREWKGNVLIGAFGVLHFPNYPCIEGRDKFRGLSLHTAEWNDELDCQHRHSRISIIGTAASAVQTIPELAKHCKQLNVFQRTPNWIAPRPDGEYPQWFQQVMRYCPMVMYMLRVFYYLRQELMFYALFTPNRLVTKISQRLFGRLMRRRLGRKENPQSGQKLSSVMYPNYPPGCKRILISNNYYRSLTHENVKVICDPISHICEEGIVTKNEESGELTTHRSDAIIYATGFQFLSGFPKIFGKVKPTQEFPSPDIFTTMWTDYGDQVTDRLSPLPPHTYLGISTPKFPNYFTMLGPNTGLGHNSVVWMIECQMNYVCDGISHMIKNGLHEMEVAENIAKTWDEHMQSDLKEKIWDRKFCRSWYQTAKGRVFAMYSGHTFSYWLETLTFDHKSYNCR